MTVLNLIKIEYNEENADKIKYKKIYTVKCFFWIRIYRDKDKDCRIFR